ASARKSGQYEHFIRYTRSLLEQIRNNGVRASVRLHLGRAYLDRNERDGAKAAFEAILKEAPGAGLAKTAKAHLYELNALTLGASIRGLNDRRIIHRVN